MKKWVSTVCLLVLLMLVFPWSVYPQTEKRGPHLDLREREFDFGKVSEGSRITHTFTVLNRGDRTLEIMKISPG